MTTAYVQNLDGSDKQKLYTTSGGNMISRLCLVDGKVYISEQSKGYDTFQITSMNTDGSDASVIYAQNVNAGDTVTLKTIAHGNMYLFRYDKGSEKIAAGKVPLDGSSSAEMPCPLNYDDIITIDEAGDHLLVLSADSMAQSAGAYTMDFDGNKLQDYIAEAS